jgi:hypothetical protein
MESLWFRSRNRRGITSQAHFFPWSETLGIITPYCNPTTVYRKDKLVGSNGQNVKKCHACLKKVAAKIKRRIEGKAPLTPIQETWGMPLHET